MKHLFIFTILFLLVSSFAIDSSWCEIVRRSYSTENNNDSGDDDYGVSASAVDDKDTSYSTTGEIHSPTFPVIPDITTTTLATTAAPKPTEAEEDGDYDDVTESTKSKKMTTQPQPRQGGGDSDPEVKPEVETKNGVVRGKIVTIKTKISGEKEVYAFTGIPFAKPPEGDLRFRRPVKKGKWNGVWDATKLPNSCQQVPSTTFSGFQGEEMWNPNTNISEDCLYLNIWIPASIFRNKGTSSASLSTVFFWIHGGGFYSGTSTLPIYDGSSLAAHQDIIVASTQYRLGALGFMYFGNDEVPGNVGLLDQNLALQWISDNVAAFGGNSADVTLFGESAGAASVSYHLISPLSRSLFKRTILMSGVATAPWAFKPKTEAVEISYKIAKEVGCWSEDLRSEVIQVIECLRRVDAKKLVSTQALHVTKTLELPLAPTIDDYFLLDTPDNLVQSWDTKKSDLIIGSVADEGSYFSVYAFQKYFNHQTSSSLSYDIFISTLREIFKDKSTFERDAIITKYTNWKNLEDGYENHKRISEALGDAFFVCPCRDFAEKWSWRGGKVFYYSFTQRSSTNPWAQWMGVMHGDEIEYALGQTAKSTTRPDGEVNTSLKFMELLTNFAKTGKPSEKWAQYTSENQVFLDINGTITSDQSASNLFGPRATECAFWNNYLPRLRQTVETTSCNGVRSVNNKFTKTCNDRAAPLISRRGKFGW